MTDQLSEIASERVIAQAARDEAERMMSAHARDPVAFRKAKQKRDASIEALERLDWAEKAEHERQEREKLQAKVDAMREAQGRAHEAHDRARTMMAEVTSLVDSLVALVKNLQVAQTKVELGVSYERFGLKDGYLDKTTVSPKIAVDLDTAVRIVRAGRELAILSGVPAQVAEERAQQGKL